MFDGQEIEYFSCELEPSFRGLLQKETTKIIAALEVLPVVKAAKEWSERTKHRRVFYFVDNDAARYELELRLDPALRPKYEQGKHADIWKRVRVPLDARRPGSVAVTWVKGHATQVHIDQGLSCELDKLGNDCADNGWLWSAPAFQNHYFFALVNAPVFVLIGCGNL